MLFFSLALAADPPADPTTPPAAEPGAALRFDDVPLRVPPPKPGVVILIPIVDVSHSVNAEIERDLNANLVEPAAPPP